MDHHHCQQQQQDMKEKESVQEDDITVHNTCLIYLDLMRLCSSIPGRFKNWYRHSSGIKDCSPHWYRFWECTRLAMRTSSKEEARKVRLDYRRKVQQQEIAAQSERAILGIASFDEKSN